VTASGVRAAITQTHREEWARVVAALTLRFGDLDVAEDAAAEAFATAVERWPHDGVPPNPGAWLTTTATRKAIDRLRRESRRDEKHQEAQLLFDDDPLEPLGFIDDDRLRLIFTCCHPALSPEARIALTLRMVGGLTVPEIARAFLVQEATMGQRITRAKAKIKAARIPYRLPTAEDLPARLDGVLTVLFLVFNEGYLATGAETEPVRNDLTAEAIRLTRLVHELLPDRRGGGGEVTGLLALMLLTEARRPARISATGELVTLDEQDRGAWDRDLIEDGHRLVRERLAAVAAGPPRAVTSCSPRSTPCTPTPATRATPTGRRSSPSTTGWCASVPRRWSRSTALSPSPRSTDPTSLSPWSTACRWRATTPSTRPAPSCCAAWAAARRLARPTTAPSSSPVTPPRPPTSPAAAASSARPTRSSADSETSAHVRRSEPAVEATTARYWTGA
jgi:RNA polymerase sigma factor (sigma-70 family)